MICNAPALLVSMQQLQILTKHCSPESATSLTVSTSRMRSLALSLPVNLLIAGFVPASLAANKNLVVLHLGTNLLEGDLEAFASAITPAEAQSRQQSSARGRKLKSTTGSRDLSMLVARKLFGGYEDKSTPQPQNWQHDVQYIKALATGDVQGARRRLQQAVAAAPAAAALPATTAALPAATATVPATAATPVVQEQPAAGGATTTTMAEQEPAEVEVPAEDPAAAAEQLPEVRCILHCPAL